ncbi:MAG: aminotransferase class III-fold pyridoxal phosphate-dependent enzyme, partial [Betaproteobacteria bacterium]
RLGNEEQALAEMSELLSTRSGKISAVIVEPRIQGGAGMVMHSVQYLQKVRALTRQHNVHLIADEIAVGCGRTGSFFAWDQVDRENWPDMVLLSKGITGGNLPLSLVMTTDKIFEAFLDNDFKKGFLHSHSYTGNPLACAAANAVLDHFDEGLEKQIRIQTDYIRQSFAHFDSEPRISNLRQCGMVLAFDVEGDIENFAEKFHLAARKHELLIRPIGQTVYVMPPFVIDKDLSQHIASAVAKTLHEVLSNAH